MRPSIRWPELILPTGLIVIALSTLTGSCSGTGSSAVEEETIQGKVMYGTIEGAVVCLDANLSGRCDGNESRALTDSSGAYKLVVPKGSTAPLVAEVVAGQSREAAASVDASYRLSSPWAGYSTHITPFTTLVNLTAERDSPVAEDMVRDMLGLPPGFLISSDSAPAAGSLTQSVAASVVAALKSSAADPNDSGVSVLQSVVAALPQSLSQLPQLQIVTKNGAPILSREVYVDATFALTNPAVSPVAAPLNGKIRGRGHSTWGQPKNPYKVQFSNDANWAKLPDVLGMKKNRNWALLADYFDRSLLRNKVAFSLANSPAFSEGLRWSPSGQHVEVTLNGDYVGVYLLTEDIRIDPARLNIKKMSTSPAVNDVDGGYIVEVDMRLDCYNAGTINLQHHTPQGAPVCIDKPDEADITPAQQAYIKNLLDATETDIYGKGSLAMINPASFADWYLLSELFRNNDSIFFSSDFMWKDTAAAVNPAHRVLNMGPIWDFDLSAGNINYNDNWKVDGCWVSKSLGYVPNWVNKLFDNPEFLNLTLARWKAKRPALEKLLNADIDTFAHRLEAAQQRNFARWPVLGAQMTNFYTFYTHAEEVAFLKRYLNERMAWLDTAYASPEAFNALCK